MAIGDLVPVFPLGTSFLPGDVVTLRVFEPRYVQLMRELPLWNDCFVSVLIAEGSEVGGGDRRFDTGVVVDQVQLVSDGEMFLVQGIADRIVDITGWLPDNPYPVASVSAQENAEDPCTGEGPSQRQMRKEIAGRITMVAQRTRTLRAMVMSETQRDSLSHIASGQWALDVVSVEALRSTLWTVARHVPCGSLDRYGFLRKGTVSERLDRIDATVEHVTEIIRFRLG